MPQSPQTLLAPQVPPPTQISPQVESSPVPFSPQVIDISTLLDDPAECGDEGLAARVGGSADPAITAAIESACACDGLFVAAGHRTDDELDAAFAAARAFFSLPPALKDRVPRINRYGYVPDRVEARTPFQRPPTWAAPASPRSIWTWASPTRSICRPWSPSAAPGSKQRCAAISRQP